MGRLTLGGGGGGVNSVTAPDNSLPAGQVNPDARINHIFFEDFSWIVEPGGTSVAANVELTDKFVVDVGGNTLEAPSPTTGSTLGRSCLQLDVINGTPSTLFPRWSVDYHSCTQMSIEAIWKISDVIQNDVVMGFSSIRVASDDPFAANGYGMLGTTTNYTIAGFNAKTGSITSAKTIVFVKYKIELNLTAGVIDDMKWFKDDVLLETLSTVEELLNDNLLPYFAWRGDNAGDPIFLDYIKVFAS